MKYTYKLYKYNYIFNVPQGSHELCLYVISTLDTNIIITTGLSRKQLKQISSFNYHIIDYCGNQTKRNNIYTECKISSNIPIMNVTTKDISNVIICTKIIKCKCINMNNCVLDNMSYDTNKMSHDNSYCLVPYMVIDNKPYHNINMYYKNNCKIGYIYSIDNKPCNLILNKMEIPIIYSSKTKVICQNITYNWYQCILYQISLIKKNHNIAMCVEKYKNPNVSIDENDVDLVKPLITLNALNSIISRNSNNITIKDMDIAVLYQQVNKNVTQDELSDIKLDLMSKYSLMKNHN